MDPRHFGFPTTASQDSGRVFFCGGNFPELTSTPIHHQQANKPAIHPSSQLPRFPGALSPDCQFHSLGSGSCRVCARVCECVCVSDELVCVFVSRNAKNRREPNHWFPPCMYSLRTYVFFLFSFFDSKKVTKSQNQTTNGELHSQCYARSHCPSPFEGGFCLGRRRRRPNFANEFPCSSCSSSM